MPSSSLLHWFASTPLAWLAACDDAAAKDVTWDLMQPQAVTLGDVIKQFRWSLGTAGHLRIAPPAFLMGFPMATAMGWLAKLRKEPMFLWAWGINGCFSVIGAALVPIVATSFGLPAVVLVGAVAYLIAIKPAFAVEVIGALDNLSTSWSVALGVLGIYVYKRSHDKSGPLSVPEGSSIARLAEKIFQRNGGGVAPRTTAPIPRDPYAGR